MIAGAVVLGGAITAGAAASHGEADDVDRPISGSALQRASDAALAHTGEGTVSGTEIGDEESYYEVEVTLDNGSEVDVQLNQSFHVVGAETDGPGEE